MDKRKKFFEELEKNGAIGLLKNQIMLGPAIIKYKIDGNIFHLDIITVIPAHRGKGYGKKAMNILCGAADKVGYTISLIPSRIVRTEGIDKVDYAGCSGIKRENMIPIKDLPKFYVKFGFKKVGKGMEREPINN